MGKFIFEFLAPKLVTIFGDNIYISMRINSIENIQEELLIKKPVVQKLEKYLRKILYNYQY